MKKLAVAEEDEGRVISQDDEGCRPIIKKKRVQFSASEMEEWEKPVSSEDFAKEDTEGDKILFVCEKPLTKSDCDKNEHHLMMTEKMISWSPLFLSDDEKELLKTRDEKNKLNKIQVELLEPTLTTCELELGRWEMKKPGKSSSVTFVLSHGWNDVVKRNGLKAGDHVEVWSFRRGSQLCLALITKRN
ncbi:hypothetical protein CRG98_045665 [Punica granatum]|uniref:TF-B3 domain-containing protein n=1 Tax=Punica granatum TaxID=22663 RepID=A0A2I0HQH8_PUNGR|nr:hypothetical protein CRG98_045665 [Punica granatum]